MRALLTGHRGYPGSVLAPRLLPGPAGLADPAGACRPAAWLPGALRERIDRCRPAGQDVDLGADPGDVLGGRHPGAGAAGGSDPYPLVAPDRVRALLRHLAGHCDLVVVLTPPVAHAPEAQILCAVADRTIVVVEKDATTASGGERVVGLLEHSTPPGAGSPHVRTRTPRPPRRRACSLRPTKASAAATVRKPASATNPVVGEPEIGRASCRERV